MVGMHIARACHRSKTDSDSHSSTEQVRLLRRATTRQIIGKVAGDTATLRSRRLSRVAIDTDVMSQSSSRRALSDLVFDFDSTIMDSPVYQRALQQWTAPSLASEPQQSQPPSRQPSISITHSSFTDEGYSSHHSGGYSNNAMSPDLAQQQENLLVLPQSPSAPVHTRSVSHTQMPLRQNIGEIRRIVSDSKTMTRGQISGSKRGKFSSILGRINTSSRISLKGSPVVSPSLSGTTLASRGRGNRLRTNFHTSIDLAKDGASVSPLIKAAQAGSRDEAERLIEQGFDIEERHAGSGRNALLVASHCGREGVVDLLIKSGARVAVTDGSRETALHLAASRGHWEVMQLLLMSSSLLKNSGFIETPNLKGRTALRVATDSGQPDAVEVLLINGAQVNARAENQMTALHAAAKGGDAEIVQLLVAHGADVEAKDGTMMTALHYACEEGHLEAIQILLENRATIDAHGRDCKTPLICAAEAGRTQAVEFLLKRKASPRDVDDGEMTALHWAAYNGHDEIVRILSEKKGLLDMVNRMGRTALHLAVIQSQFAVVEFLQRKKAPLEIRCNTGLTALHYACMADSFEITRLLLLANADVEAAESQNQERPLHIVAGRGSVFLLDLLCDKRAALDARNKLGDRPLDVACRFGHVDVAKKLLDRGSTLGLKVGTWPLCLAAMGGHWHLASLLLERGASPVKEDEAGWQPIRCAAYYGQPDVLHLFLTSGKMRDADIAKILNMPDTIGFSPGVPEDRMDQVRQLINQTFSQSLQRSMMSNPLDRQYGISQVENQRNSLSGPFTPPPAQQQMFPAPVEADSSTQVELPGSLDREISSRFGSLDTSPRTATPESGPPNQNPPPLTSDRVTALVRESRGSSPLRNQNRRYNGSRSRSRSGTSDAPLVSATFTPVSSSSFISPPPHQSSSSSHRPLTHRSREVSVSRTTASRPTSDLPSEVERIPRTIPTNSYATVRAGSRTRTHRQDDDHDSDSDSISSVYTAPENQAGLDTAIHTSIFELA